MEPTRPTSSSSESLTSRSTESMEIDALSAMEHSAARSVIIYLVFNFHLSQASARNQFPINELNFFSSRCISEIIMSIYCVYYVSINNFPVPMPLQCITLLRLCIAIRRRVPYRHYLFTSIFITSHLTIQRVSLLHYAKIGCL